jgi:tRNA1(Val) A37 N6-methylase TrmN6
VVARGHVSFIHRADALADLLAAMQPRLGALSILPIAPRQNAPANRVIVRGRRDSRAPLKILPAVYLQNPDGQASDLAEAILRDGCALAFDTADG